MLDFSSACAASGRVANVSHATCQLKKENRDWILNNQNKQTKKKALEAPVLHLQKWTLPTSDTCFRSLFYGSGSDLPREVGICLCPGFYWWTGINSPTKGYGKDLAQLCWSEWEFHYQLFMEVWLNENCWWPKTKGQFLGFQYAMQISFLSLSAAKLCFLVKHSFSQKHLWKRHSSLHTLV